MDRWRAKKSGKRDQVGGIVGHSGAPRKSDVDLVASVTWKTGHGSATRGGVYGDPNDMLPPTSGTASSENEATGWQTPTGGVMMHDSRDVDGGGAASLHAYPIASPHQNPPSRGISPGAGFPSEKLTSGREGHLSKQETCKTRKRKLRLLNPMSLFLRRRSTQEAVGLQPLSTIAMKDYCIRGEGIHDFSAPKPRSPQVRRDLRSPHLRSLAGNTSDSRSPHEGRVEREGAGQPPISNSSDANPSFSAGPTDTNIDGPHNSGSHYQQDSYSPDGNVLEAASAESLNPLLGINTSEGSVFPANVPFSPASGIAANLDEAGPHSDVLERLPATDTEVPGSMSLNRNFSNSTGQMNEHHYFQAEAIPKHMRSNASSRFSFDLVGAESANQEHLLEEKHRKIMSSGVFRQQGPRQRREMQVAAPSSDTESDEGSASISEHSAVFEEMIPGVNVDATNIEEEATIPSLVSGFHSAPLPGIVNLDKANGTVSDINLARTNGHSAQLDRKVYRAGIATSEQPTFSFHLSNLNHITVEQQVAEEPSATSPTITTDANWMTSAPMVDSSDGESHYDDEIPELSQSGPFSNYRQVALGDRDDVSVRDTSKHGSLLRVAEQVLQTSGDTIDLRQQSAGHNEHEMNPIEMDERAMEHVMLTEGVTIVWPNSNQPTIPEEDIDNPPPNSCTPGKGALDCNLAIRHNALGAFVESPSSANNLGPFSQTSESNTNVVTDWEVPRLEVSDANETFCNETFNSVEYSSDLEEEGNTADDDPIIAAANAEVLASDAEGFYGQEFGFYANANDSSDSEYALGGFFGSPGNDGLFRSHSGNAAFREPNLTPITERSEYSTRSSFVFPHMSATTHPAAQPLQNHSLALASRIDLSSVDDLSLANLQKLRRSAWGGSDGSLGSADSLGGGSLPRIPPLPQSTPGFSMSTSRLSLTGTADASSWYGSSSDGHPSAPASPTLTQLDILQNQESILGSAELSLASEEQAPPCNKSEHKTESVRYVKDEDSSGQTRWVVERLRRLESGTIEVLGREVVSGGRI